MSGSDAADSAMPAPSYPTPLPANDLPLGQPPPFVAPRTYLEQAKPQGSPKPMTAIDREQMEGLVCVWKQT
jgi:hypothetical protein